MGVWLQPLQGQGAPDSHGASAVPPHPAFACLAAADPFAVDPLADELLAADLLAADLLAADPLAAGPAAEDSLAVEPLAADPLALCAAAAAAAAEVEQADVEQVEVEAEKVEEVEQLQLALALTLTASLAWLACHPFLSGLAFQPCLGPFLSFAAALQSPAAAFPGPCPDGFAVLPVA